MRTAQADVHARPLESAGTTAADDGAATLVLTPTESSPPEITGTLIMRLVSEIQPDSRQSQAVVEMATGDGAISPLKERAVRQALRLRGSRYRYGGTSRGGFDCSGFTRYVYARLGIALPHSSTAQFGCGNRVSPRNLKPGDLVFFGRGRRSIGHVGIYVGGNRFVHAANPGRGVVVDRLFGSSYERRFRGARRLRGS